MAQPLPDPSGWQITPTLRNAWTPTTDPANTTLKTPFTVAILGASRGIGVATACAYATAGASGVLITGRDEAALAAGAKEIKAAVPLGATVDVRTAVCDITKEADLEAVAAQIREAWNRLDVLVVNAGVWEPTTAQVTGGNADTIRQVLDTNLVGAFLAAHVLVPLLLASEGGAKAFVAMCGIGAWVVDGPGQHAVYCVSKLAQARLVEHLANAFAGDGLLAVAVHPGGVWTDTSKLAPEMFHPLLTDPPGLCGGFLVWLTRNAHGEDKFWLSGRFLSATWDADELQSMKEAIVTKDLLKARMAVS